MANNTNKKKYLFFLTSIVTSTPLFILMLCYFMTIPVKKYQSISETTDNKEIIIPQIVFHEKTKPSQIFLNGYYDGWRGKVLGPIRWMINEDYRQGHMLGIYDRKKGVDRYKE